MNVPQQSGVQPDSRAAAQMYISVRHRRISAKLVTFSAFECM